MDEDHSTRPDPEQEQSAWRRVVSGTEGRVLVAGFALLVAYAVLIGLMHWHEPRVGRRLVAMVFSHLAGGRAAGLSSGYATGMPHWAVLAANMVTETILVMLFYPLFVFSYHKLIIIKPLEDTMARIRAGAEAHQRTIIKFGIPGLIVFVWFPFAMTGPVVGSALGFLVGLPARLTILVVLLGTYMAILSWSLVFRRLHYYMLRIGPFIPFLFVGAIILLAVSIHIRYAFTRHANNRRARAQPPPERGDALAPALEAARRGVVQFCVGVFLMLAWLGQFGHGKGWRRLGDGVRAFFVRLTGQERE